MRSGDEVNNALAAFNGSVLILALYCVVFLALHLWATGVRSHMTWRRWLFRTPLGMQIAVAVSVICVGEVFTRGAIWVWRYLLAGDPGRLGQQRIMLGLGALILAAGFLCVLRVISRPFGAWPITAAVLTVLAYLATFIPGL